MDEKIKYWILLSTDNEDRKKGINCTKLFEERPDFVYDDFSQFLTDCNEIENEGLLAKNEKIPTKYAITKKGKKELENYLVKLNDSEYLKFASLTPEREIRYRINTIEYFLSSLIMTIILSIIIYYFLIKKGSINTYLNFILLTLYFLFVMLFISSLINLLTTFFIMFIKRTSKNIFDFVENYHDKISNLLIVLTVITSMILLPRLLGYTFKSVALEIFVALSFLVVTNRQKIKNILNQVQLKFINKK